MAGTPTTPSSDAIFRRLCIFCGSSRGSDPRFVTAARHVGAELARRGIGLVYGGGNVGLMGEVADAALAAGGEVIGVIPQFLVDAEAAHFGLTKLHIVQSMHERKAMMAELSDGFIALPGGFGTLEELMEIVTWSQLHLHTKPVAVLNVAGFFTPLLAMLDNMVHAGLLKPKNRELLIDAAELGECLDAMSRWQPQPTPKWIRTTAAESTEELT